ncbi:Fe-S cluster biosynthesis protein [Lentilactobacillus fungorum]|uniref:Fe-S cluster biosynthesis protein n=1 Tax=Lentilactobacillus fungorum TaxID=2201250 RepID=A0ABQ3W2I8_9LACO|nr:iron-sulfur cluster biosynthesis family protein [Lentilactobacillus fungorum]GHP15030.1 Fe-S cluster biosynthesis protein [Lentilactobacillus fungorum]
MPTIKITVPMKQYLSTTQFAGKTFLLIADDGGGNYSLHGGACTIGGNFTLVVLDQPDERYPIPLKNNAEIPLFTSAYDLNFLGAGLKMDFQHHSIRLSDDAELLDSAVQITQGTKVTKAFEAGMTPMDYGC